MKNAGIIDKVTISEATFDGSKENEFHPSVINFFYGQNGTGKTTVSNAIIDRIGLTVSNGYNLDEYETVYFNQAFVSENLTKISSGAGLGAVYVLDEENRKLQEVIRARTKDLDKAHAAIKAVDEANAETLKENKKDTDRIENEIWNRCERFRNSYKSSTYPVFKGKETTSKSVFAGALKDKLTAIQSKEDVPTSLEIDDYYKNVVTATEVVKKPIIQRPVFSFFTQENWSSLLQEPLFNKPTTQFGEFLKKYQITEAFKEYHDKVHGKTDGLCPYCSRKLPDDFDQTVADAFDASFTNGLTAIRNLHSQYSSSIVSLGSEIDKIKAADWVSLDDKKTFSDVCNLILITLGNNLKLIDQKIKAPGESIVLDSITGIQEAFAAIDSNNQKAIAENEHLSDKAHTVEHFRDMLLGYMASLVRDELAQLSVLTAAKSTIETEHEKARNEKQAEYNNIKADIENISKTAKDTSGTIKAINTALHKSGFSGFHLEEIDHTTHAIQVIRDRTHKPATHLSEGEKNFLMFLYFYHKTKGASGEDRTIKNKIIVIDDPVSSMDSRALFIISSLTKELIGITASNFNPDIGLQEGYDYIKQFFLFTHNPYFFRDVAEPWIEPYDYINFYEISKPGNISQVALKTKVNPDNRIDFMNDIPVKNAYNSLWKTYLTTTDKNVFMVTCQQILSHYFVQTCSIKGDILIDKILKTHQDELIHGDDFTDYHIVESMLACLTLQTEDDFYYDTSAIDIDYSRTVFGKRKINRTYAKGK